MNDYSSFGFRVKKQIEHELQQGKEDDAILILKSFQSECTSAKPAEPQVPAGFLLLSVAIRNKCTKFVRFLCLEFAPNNRAMHEIPYGGKTSLMYAIYTGCEEMALFLHSLGICDVNLHPDDRKSALEEAECRGMGQLLLVLLRDPQVKLTNDEGYYKDALLRVLANYGTQYQDVILKRLACDINRRFRRDDPAAQSPHYLLSCLVKQNDADLVLHVLDHPAIDITQICQFHLSALVFALFITAHDHAAFASIVLRLNHAQRKNALREWQEVLNLPPMGGPNMSPLIPQCIVPNRCPSNFHSGFSHDQLVKNATPKRFGWIAYPLNQYGLQVFGLFLLYQDGYVAGDMGNGWKRYFYILQKLPLDMQMVMCRRLHGSDKDIYTGKQIEECTRKHLGWYAVYANTQQDIANKRGK
jgi:hypothetical protein